MNLKQEIRAHKMRRDKERAQKIYAYTQHTKNGRNFIEGRDTE